MTTALFVLKRREDYSSDPSYSGSYQIATGMYNSAKFVSDMLNRNGVTSDVTITIDNNTIDAELVAFNPKVVFLEGIWVTPAKLQELKALPRHAGRTFVVRVHSDTPFIATEGIAMERIFGYLEIGVPVACNSNRIHSDLMVCAKAMGYTDVELETLLLVLPNYYPRDFQPLTGHDFNYTQKETLNIACFGAWRPMKNHLQQAMAAVKFVSQTGQKLRFHVNDRTDQGGAPPLKNVKALFDRLPSDQFELVLHPWQSHEAFLATMADMDILMQVSFSETFNIVAADATWVGRPLVVSDEVGWAFPMFADPTDAQDMVKILKLVSASPAFFVNHTRQTLNSYLACSKFSWLQFTTPFNS